MIVQVGSGFMWLVGVRSV